MIRIFFTALLFLAAAINAPAMATRTSHQVATLSEAIGVRTLKFVDEARNRPLTMEVWYPIRPSENSPDDPKDPVWIHPKEIRDVELAGSEAKYPVIIMSHGHRGDRRERTWLAEILVRNGFVVVAVEHFGNTWHLFNPLSSLRFWDRVKDISFGLDKVFDEPFLREKIDPSRIGFVGYSLGGMTGLGLAGATAKNTKEIAKMQQAEVKELSADVLDTIDFSEAEQNHKEVRIRSFLLLFPANFVYPPESLQKIKAPVGLVASLSDEVLPHKDHAYQIIQHVVPKKLKVMREGISHYALLNRVTEKGKRLLQKDARGNALSADRASLHKEIGDFALEFFNETLDHPNK